MFVNPFLTQVVDDPDCDDARLIYADWLEEAGDPRGEFIRSQCFCEKSSELELDYYDHFQRQYELLCQHRDAWVGELNQDLRKARFHRGFIESVTVLASQLVKSKCRLLEEAPIHWLRLNRLKGRGPDLAELPSLSKLRGLDISGLVISPEDLQAIVDSPYLVNLERLDLRHHSSILDQALQKIFKKSLVLGRLKRLELSRGDGLLDGIEFPKLESLVLELSDGQSEFREIRFSAPNLVNLEMIDTSPQSYDEFDIDWRQLQNIVLSGSRFYPKTISELSTAGAFENTEEVRLELPESLRLDVDSICDSGNLSNCRRLSFGFQSSFYGLVRHPIKHKLASALVDASHIDQLEELTLSDLGPGELSRLVKAPHLQTLKSLRLRRSFISREDVLALIESPLKDSLLRLGMANIFYKPGAAKELVSHYFPNVICFEVGEDGLLHSTGAAEEIVPLLVGGALPGMFPNLRLLNFDLQHPIGWTLSDFTKLSLPELRIFSYQHGNANQSTIRELLTKNNFPKLFQVRAHGTIATKNLDKFHDKYGHKVTLDLYHTRSQ